jgi:N utilization substance protein A
MGRAIVLVKEDQLSLAIGRRGQNVRLASKLVGWDIEIMTIDEMNESIERAVGWFSRIPGISDELVEMFVTEGFMSFVDVTFIEPTDLAELGNISVEDAEAIIQYAEEAAERIETHGDEPVDEEAMAGRTVVGQAVESETPTEEAAPESTDGEVVSEEAAPETPSEEAAPEETATNGMSEVASPDHQEATVNTNEETAPHQ